MAEDFFLKKIIVFMEMYDGGVLSFFNIVNFKFDGVVFPFYVVEDKMIGKI